MSANPAAQESKVAIIVPIYNVAPYLDECLASIKNQTYENLFIILVNDGSTDESAQIALDFIASEPRAVMIDKPNGGLSSARNAGLCLLLGELEVGEFAEALNADGASGAPNSNLPQPLLSATLTFKEKSQMSEYLGEMKMFAGEKFTKNFKKSGLPSVDLFEFVDSDDFIVPFCVEQCVARMHGVDVLIFDVQTKLEGVADKNWRSSLWWLGLCDKERIITRDEWLGQIEASGVDFWYFSVFGMIDFEFYKKTRIFFVNGIVQEDDLFGTQLFCHARKIYCYPEKCYIYRLRAGTSMDYDEDKNDKNGAAGKNGGKKPPSYCVGYEVFDAQTGYEYYRAMSHATTALALNELLKTLDPNARRVLESKIMPTYIRQAMKILSFKKDPKNLAGKIRDVFGLKPFFVKTKRKFGGENFGLFSQRKTRLSSGKVAQKCSYLMLFGRKATLFRVVFAGGFRYIVALGLRLRFRNER